MFAAMANEIDCIEFMIRRAVALRAERQRAVAEAKAAAEEAVVKCREVAAQLHTAIAICRMGRPANDY